MPVYLFDCPCGWAGELILKVSERDQAQSCPDCGEKLARIPTAHTDGTGPKHQTSFIMGNGEKIPFKGARKRDR